MKHIWFGIFAAIGVAIAVGLIMIACALNHVAEEHGKVAAVCEKSTTEVARLNTSFESLAGEVRRAREEVKAIFTVEFIKQLSRKW